ncbi:MAG: tRNA (guanosine(46)-N7)-methyltransferase TrmB [Gammaproteobacteria bacterium]|nr:tRNA (guanosine(46)-N7)-methyltransferase TrmB [Gammaproteobacteria bacterium]
MTSAATGDSSGRRSIRSYVLRAGRMTNAQRLALDELSDVYGISSEAPRPLDFDQLFGRSAPRVLDIGFGVGDALVEMASANSDQDFIGVDVFRGGVGNLYRQLAERQLTNVRAVCDDAVDLLKQQIAPGSLNRVNLFFPDPWPKAKHHKRRLVQAPFLELIRSRVAVGGHIHLATDWAEYAEFMLAQIAQVEGLRNTAGEGQYAARPASRPLTKYERRGQRLGHTVVDLVLEVEAV